MVRYALFLDRDGIINIDHGYVHRREDFEFIEGIFDVARYAYEHNFKLVVVTNQAGIGRGYYSEAEFNELTVWMCEQFSTAGCPIDKVYFSPYHPIAGVGHYRKDDFSRKPNPGMILQARAELGLDLERSVLIGDQFSDIQAGIAAGVGRNLLLSSLDEKVINIHSYERIASLRDAVPYLEYPTASSVS